MPFKPFCILKYVDCLHTGLFYPYTLKIKCTKLTELKTTKNKGVFGIACLDDMLFVATHAAQIDVYQKVKTKYEKFVGITNSKLPSISDLASCPCTKRLFISDFEKFGVWMITSPLSITANSQNVEFERFVKVNQAQGLSVSAKGRVLVVTGHPYAIFVFDCNGIQEKYVDLAGIGIEDPYQAVLDVDCNFIVCSGLYENQTHRLTKISYIGESVVRTDNRPMFGSV